MGLHRINQVLLVLIKCWTTMNIFTIRSLPIVSVFLLIYAIILCDKSHQIKQNEFSDLLDTRVGHAVNHFATQLINQLKNYTNNTLFSPISIATALFLVHLGIEKNSDSANQFSHLFDFKRFNLDTNNSRNNNNPHKGLHYLTKYLTDAHIINGIEDNLKVSNKQLNFTNANILLANKDSVSDLDEDFQATIDKYYDVTVAQFKQIYPHIAPFYFLNDILVNKSSLLPSSHAKQLISFDVKEQRQIVEAINTWTQFKTNDTIHNVLDEQNLASTWTDLPCILVNACHLSARWKRQFFRSSDTIIDDWHYSLDYENVRKRVPFMRSFDQEFAYFNSADHNACNNGASRQTPHLALANFRAFELPLDGAGEQHLSLVILLPNQLRGLEALTMTLNWSTLIEIYSCLKKTRFGLVTLPKFSLEQRLDVRTQLENMDVNKVFYKQYSNLTRMFKTVRGDTLKMETISHMTNMVVNEQGIGIIGSTYQQVQPDNSHASPIYSHSLPSFEANHEFLFVVRHKKTQASLFMGRVVQL